MITVKYFSTSWCQPCKTFAPVFDKVMSETGTIYNKIDAESNKELAIKYNVTSVPTLIFERDGVVVGRHTGVMSAPQLKGWINRS